MNSPITLSIATPAYNEGDGIATVIVRWRTYLKNHPAISAFEIVVCNDGSRDKTKEVLDALSQQFSEVRVIHLPTNQGAASALAHAITQTKLDWILLTDADDQFPIENFSNLLDRVQASKAQAAIGIRNKQDHWFARWGSKISGQICNLVHGSRLKDFNSAFKLVNGPLLRTYHLEAKGMNYSTEITSRLIESKVPIVEVAIDHQARKIGKSHIKLLRDTIHRALFVFYLSLRQLLLRVGILRRQ